MYLVCRILVKIQETTKIVRCLALFLSQHLLTGPVRKQPERSRRYMLVYKYFLNTVCKALF